ncbi:MAG: hypothetical protein U0514_00560 [Candidatus Andersenbacteria bacterium]
MSRPLLWFTIAFGVLFVGGLVWFVVRANGGLPGQGTPGPSSLFDSDQDGLTDAREQQLGTNPNDKDSDHDGLSDGQEVSTYRTNPLNADSDGDGYSDGVEVSGGYDPLKAGGPANTPLAPTAQ